MPHYVDLHSHYLPALDDGATSLEMSVQMTRAIASLGFSHLYATPHQRAGMFMPARAQIDAAFAQVQATLGAGAPKLGLAAENFWDLVFHDWLRGQAVPTYDETPAFLFEVNTQMMPADMENQLFQIERTGTCPSWRTRSGTRPCSATRLSPSASGATPSCSSIWAPSTAHTARPS